MFRNLSKNRPPIVPALVAVAGFAALMIAACDVQFDPIDRERGQFSVFGALDLNEEVNYIRIGDMNSPLTTDSTRNINASVKLENLESGDQTILESEVWEYEDIFLHNYRVEEELTPDTHYRLSIQRPNGSGIEVSILTPTRAEAQAEPLNQTCHSDITLEFSPVNGGSIELRVGTFLPNRLGTMPHWGSTRILQPDEDRPEEPLTFTFKPIEMIQLVPQSPGSPSFSCHHLREDMFRIRYTHYSRGFLERVLNDPFDIMFSTERLGALYEDSLDIPIDTTRICPPDC